MPIIVQKYGGTSIGTIEKLNLLLIKSLLKRIKEMMLLLLFQQ